MTPHRYSIKDGVTTFHYHFSELREFITLGKEHGDVGMLLVKRDGNTIIYRGFGVISNPCKSILTFSFVHNPAFGEMSTDDQRLIKPKSFFTRENTKFVMLDTSKINRY